MSGQGFEREIFHWERAKIKKFEKAGKFSGTDEADARWKHRLKSFKSLVEIAGSRYLDQCLNDGKSDSLDSIFYAVAEEQRQTVEVNFERSCPICDCGLFATTLTKVYPTEREDDKRIVWWCHDCHYIEFIPDFVKRDGLIVAIIQDQATKQVLMQAYMNEEAWVKTLETGEVWFWSTSDQKLWLKGETSGNILKCKEWWLDCDQDSVLISVQVQGDGLACHFEEVSCFHNQTQKKEF